MTHVRLEQLEKAVADLRLRVRTLEVAAACAAGTAKLTPGTYVQHNMHGRCLIIQRPNQYPTHGAFSGIELVWVVLVATGEIIGAHPERLSIL